MITLLHGTNRPDSMSGRVAAFYRGRLDKKNVPYKFFSLNDLPDDLFTQRMYKYNSHEGLVAIQDEFLKPAGKFIIVVPEYNGGFPGVFKAFVDASDIKACWHNKKACLVGVSAGRAGNLRGMNQLTNLLNHIKVNVLHLKIPISSIESVIDDDDQIAVPEIVSLIDTQIDLMTEF